MYQPALIAKYRNPLYQTNTFIIKLIHFYIHTHTYIKCVCLCVRIYRYNKAGGPEVGRFVLIGPRGPV